MKPRLAWVRRGSVPYRPSLQSGEAAPALSRGRQPGEAIGRRVPALPQPRRRRVGSASRNAQRFQDDGARTPPTLTCGTPRWPPSASAFAIRLDFCDSPTATDARRRLPLRRTRSRLWLALCEPPTASAFAIRLDFCDSPSATDARRRLPLRRTRSRLWLALCEPPTASAFAIRLGFCDSPSRGE